VAIPESNPSKTQLRGEMRQRLRESPLDPAPICIALERWLKAHPELRVIASFSPLPSEVDFTSILPKFPHLKWVYPRITGPFLTFHSGEQRAPGTLGILEPTLESPEIPLGEIDAFLCPGLAFDFHKHRLGRGRGFYDRILAQARSDSWKIGICFPFQRVPDTFPEAHDVRMDTVIHG
jgi:5-formyltetrahydrofolate cyclo-ligase